MTEVFNHNVRMRLAVHHCLSYDDISNDRDFIQIKGLLNNCQYVVRTPHPPPPLPQHGTQYKKQEQERLKNILK